MVRGAGTSCGGSKDQCASYWAPFSIQARRVRFSASDNRFADLGGGMTSSGSDEVTRRHNSL